MIDELNTVILESSARHDTFQLSENASEVEQYGNRRNYQHSMLGDAPSGFSTGRPFAHSTYAHSFARSSMNDSFGARGMSYSRGYSFSANGISFMRNSEIHGRMANPNYVMWQQIVVYLYCLLCGWVSTFLFM